MVDYIRSVTYWKFLISYIFSISVKFGTGHRSVGRVQNNECYFKFSYIFFDILFLFFIMEFVHLSFSFLFCSMIKFPLQIMNQSEADIGVQKLSLQLYIRNQFTGFYMRATLAFHGFMIWVSIACYDKISHIIEYFFSKLPFFTLAIRLYSKDLALVGHTSKLVAFFFE